jgi:hypothetical protein
MRKLYLFNCLLAGVALFVLSLSGCGDDTRNDQGVSFTFLGWFNDTSGTVGVTAIAAPLSGSNPEVPTDQGGTIGGIIAKYAGLQNNLSGQTIRAERAYHSYFVPGASIQPPSTSVSVALTLGPASENDDLPFEGESTLPGNLSKRGDVGYAGVPVVTADVRDFINMNRERFPEPPFVMEVTTYVSGVTSAGNRLETNEFQIEVIWTPDNVVAPTSGGASSGSGSSSSAASEKK